MLTVRVKIQEDESLTGFLRRLSSYNGISIQTLWNLVKSDNWKRTHIQYLHLIDYSPTTTVNMQLLQEMSEIPSDRLLHATFYYALNKFGHSDRISHARFLKGVIRTRMFYCPYCLREKPFFRLKWKVNGIKYCLQHQCYLLDYCLQCGEHIDLKRIEIINYCPNCLTNLANFNTKAETNREVVAQNWLHSSWDMLLANNTKHRLGPSEAALRLIYFLNNEKNQYMYSSLNQVCRREGINLQSILQYARNTLKEERMIHITHLLKILYLRDKTPIDLFDIHPPEEFLYHVLYKPENQLDLHCIAPWCSSYKKKSTLKRTGTKRKIKKNGEMHCDYQTCMECGCEYYWNEKDEQIDKRQYIQCYPFILSNATLIELMEKTQLSETKCRHIMAYFKTRLDQFGVYNLNVQNLRRLKTAVYRDLRMSEIRSWNCWDNEDHFLEYWYHQDIISEKLFFQKKVSERIPREKILTQIKEICKTYIEANMDISLKNVAKEVGVSTNTISDWQVAQDYIKEMKRHQREGRLNIRKEQLYNQVNEFIDNFTGRKLHSKDIYEHIQVKQSFLTTAAPDLVKYITGRRKEYNRQMYDVKNF